MPDTLAAIQQDLRKFAADRDWDQFHSPRNLATALSVEAAELLENFQWLGREEQLDAGRMENVREEVADVLIYLLRLADKLDIDLLRAARHKMELNARKYPVDKSRGNMKKYTDL